MRPGSDDAGGKAGILLIQQKVVCAFEADEALGMLGGLEPRARMLAPDDRIGGRM